MKVLLVSHSDVDGGAARAAYRLKDGLRAEGADARMLVAVPDTRDPSVIAPQTKLQQGLAVLRTQFDYRSLRRYPKRNKTLFSPAVVREDLAKRVAAERPDVVHVHWVQRGTMRVKTLRDLPRPLVWTLHDMWAFTGGCHYAGDCTRYRERCGACPVLGSTKENDLSRTVWHRKRLAWTGLNPVVVTPSRWMAECARQSALLGDWRIEVIPNGLDLGTFRPHAKRVARDLLGLPQERRLVLFGAMLSTSDPRKGYVHLEAAARRLAGTELGRSTELVVFGAFRPLNAPDLGMPCHYVGELHDQVSLALLYAAADAMVVPSTQDNYPNTAAEALACGTPVVAFRVSGLPEMVEHKATGYLAEPFDDADLAAGIAWAIGGSDAARQAIGESARAWAEENLDLATYAKRHLALYEELAGR